MKKVKQSMPTVIILILTAVVIGIVLNLMSNLFFYSEREQQFYYLVTLVGAVLFLVIARQLISIRHNLREDKNNHMISTEFDLMINLLYRNQRETNQLRQNFYRETRLFIEEINQFIPADTYRKYLATLLDASAELEQLESEQEKSNTRKKKRPRRKSEHEHSIPAELISRQNALVELGIVELTSKVLIAEGNGQDEVQLKVDHYTKIYQTDYQKLSSMFDAVTIILRFLNQKVTNDQLSESQYQHYLSIVRNLLSREDLLLVLMYALVIPEGCPLGIDLIGSSFFGNQTELLQKKYVDYPELLAKQLTRFTQSKTIKKSLNEQKIVRYYYEASLKEIATNKLTKIVLIEDMLQKSSPNVAAPFNFLQLLDISAYQR